MAFLSITAKFHCCNKEGNDSLDSLGVCKSTRAVSPFPLLVTQGSRISLVSTSTAPTALAHRDQGSLGSPQETSLLSDSELYTIKGPQVILPLPGQKENQRLLFSIFHKGTDFWPHSGPVKKKIDQKEKKWKIPSAGQANRLTSILLHRHMKSGHAGKKHNFLHNVFTFHSIYTTGSHPSHFPSILAEEILRTVSLGRRNIKLDKLKKWKSHLACLLLSQIRSLWLRFLDHFPFLETSHFTNFSKPKNHQ